MTARPSPPEASDETPGATADDDPLIGRALAGGYELLSCLGRGGSGAVYAARARPDSAGARAGFDEVAVKVLERAESKAARARFAREAALAREATSPHLVRVLDAGTDPAAGDYLVMERLRGRDLAAWLRDVRALRPDVAARIGVQAARGLAALAALGVVHRDVKPSNLFLHETDDGSVVVRLVDLGVARQAGGDATASHVVGSPMYMAPEQLAAPRAVGARADVFSLCLSLYRALAGAHPWEHAGRSVPALLHLRERGVPRLADVAPWVPPALARVVDRGVSRDPDARWPSADALAEELAAWSADAPITKRELATNPAASPEEAARRLVEASSVAVPDDQEPPPSLALLGLAVLAALVALLALATALTSRPGIPAPAPAASAAPVAPGAPGACDRERPCARGQRCVGAPRACVPLVSEDCRVEASADALDDPETLWLAAFFPLSGPEAEGIGNASLSAVELARRDFEEVPGGRRIGLLVCDDTRDPLRAADHVAHAGVSAIIGFRSSKEAIAVAARVVPRGVMVIPSLNGSALITAIPHPAGSPRLVYRTSVSTAVAARPIAALVSQLVAKRAAPAEARVALVRHEQSMGVAFADDVLTALRVSGVPARQLGKRLLDLSFDAAATSHADRVDELLAHRPDVVVLSGLGDDVVASLVAPLEARWPRSAPRPVYVGYGTLEGDDVARFVRGDPGRGGRLLGLTTPTETPENHAFTAHYNRVFRTSLTPGVSPGAPYDAAYLAAYAAIAGGAASPDGSALSAGVARLVPPGPAVAVGPEGISAAVAWLRLGGRVDLVGAFSRLDFDLASGESTADLVVHCAVPTATGQGIDSVETGARYDATSDALRGEIVCPGAR